MNNKIVLYPDPILRVKCAKITDFPGNWAETAESMTKLLRESGGVGISGPQCGIASRIIIVKHGYEEYTALCNPQIVIMSNAQLISDFEGCLSMPGITGKVTRPDKILVHYQDCKGDKQEFYAYGLLSRIIQHEVDHLNGRLFIDRMSKKNLEVIKPQLDKLVEDYKTLMNNATEVLPTSEPATA